MAAKHVLGLHTKKEREYAYKQVSEVYAHAMHRKATSHDVQYALGYTDAVLDLVMAEARGDVELVEALGNMRDALLEKSALPFPG